MNCDRVNDLLVEYLYGELAPADMAAIHAHLDECPRCAAEADALGRVRTLAAGLPDPEPSRMVLGRITALAREDAEEKRSGWGWGWLKILTTCCVVAIAGGLYIYQKQTGLYPSSTQTAPAKHEVAALAPEKPGPADAAEKETAASPEEEPLSRGLTPAPSVAAEAQPGEALETEEMHRVAGTTLFIESDTEAKTEAPVQEDWTPGSYRVKGTMLVVEIDPNGRKKPEGHQAPGSYRVEGTMLVVEPENGSGPARPAKTAALSRGGGTSGGGSRPASMAAPEASLPPDRSVPVGSDVASLDHKKAKADTETKLRGIEEESRPDELARGRQALEAKRYDEAVRHLVQAAAELPPGHPERPRALLLLAEAYEAQGRKDLAEAAYRRLAEESPDHRALAEDRIHRLSSK